MRPLLIGALGLLAACGGGSAPEPAAPDTGSSAVVGGDQRVVFGDWTRWKADPVTISSASIARDTLSLEVRYGGGCAEHSFTLVVSEAWAESYPVQAGALLAHDAHGDRCRALFTRTLRFDLSPVRDAYRRSYGGTGGKVSLGITGGPRVLYEF